MMAGLHTEGGELDDGDYIAKEVGTVKMTTCASPAYLDQHGTRKQWTSCSSIRPSTGLTAATDKLCPYSGRQRAPPKLNFRAGLSWITQETYIAAGTAGLGIPQDTNIFAALSRSRAVGRGSADNTSPNRNQLLYRTAISPKSAGRLPTGWKVYCNALGACSLLVRALPFIGPPASVWLHGREHRQTSAQ